VNLDPEVEIAGLPYFSDTDHPACRPGAGVPRRLALKVVLPACTTTARPEDGIGARQLQDLVYTAIGTDFLPGWAEMFPRSPYGGFLPPARRGAGRRIIVAASRTGVQGHCSPRIRGCGNRVYRISIPAPQRSPLRLPGPC